MSERETREIPKMAREAIDRRDHRMCRFCGKWLGQRRSIHHIQFGGDRQGMGGRRNHDLDNLLTVCWLPGDNDCHQRLHAEKDRWMEFALRAAREPGTTVLALERWQRRKELEESAR